MPKEIITLQLGTFSNHVGAHWWNIQESCFTYNDDKNAKAELDHDVLFREGHNSKVVTFTPRLVFVDFNKNLGTLPLRGSLYETPVKNAEEEPVCWDKVEVHKTSPILKNEFLQDLCEEDQQYDDWFNNHIPNGSSSSSKNSIVNTVNVTAKASESKTYYLDRDVRTWTDFKKTHYHPRSTVTLKENFRDSEMFDAWITGVNLYKTSDAFTQVEEAVRFYAEECDSMQGFHVLCDLNSGFGGFSSMLMEYLRDEFPGKSFATFLNLHAAAGGTLSKMRSTSLSSVLTLSSLLETSSFVCPMSVSSDFFRSKPRTFPQLIYNASLQYHSSAILASCLENATRPYRLKSSLSSLQHLTDHLVSGSRRLVGMSAAIPLPFDTEKYQDLLDLLLDHSISEPWSPMTPNFSETSLTPEKCFSQAVSLCGLGDNQFFPESKRKVLNFSRPNDVIDQYLSERHPSARNSVYVTTKPIPTSAPFPHIFTKNVLQNGFKKSPQTSSFFVSKLGSIEPQFLTKSPRKDSGEPSKTESVAINVASIPVVTNLKSSTCLTELLKRCHDRASALKKWVSQNRHADALIEQDALEEATERFKTLEQDYRYLTQHDSDSSD